MSMHLARSDRDESWSETIALIAESNEVSGGFYRPILESARQLQGLGMNAEFFASQSHGRFAISLHSDDGFGRPYAMITALPDGRIGCELGDFEPDGSYRVVRNQDVHSAAEATDVMAEYAAALRGIAQYRS